MSQKFTKHTQLSQTLMVIFAVIGAAILLFFGAALYFMAREDWPRQIAQKDIGNKQTVRIYAKTTWDNWCFVQSVEVYDATSGKSTDLTLGSTVFNEHCPDEKVTPWVISEGSSRSFKLLVSTANGVKYDTYVFDEQLGAYHTPEPLRP